jgi:UDP-N-acetylmuramate dehydrogenase
MYSKLNTTVSNFIETDKLYIVKNLIRNYDDIYFVGNGSKIFFTFEEKNLLIIRYVKDDIKKVSSFLIVDSGCSLYQLGEYTIKNCIKGFEKLMTIPGFVGGSIVNNSSFLNQCISDYLYAIEVIDQSGKIRIIKRDEISFSYRKTIFNIKNFFISKAIFKIEYDSKEVLLENKKIAYDYRYINQPKIHSLGSTFKNVSKFKAYQLLKLNCLKLDFGGYHLNKRHANFIKIQPDLDKLNLVKLIESIQEVLYNELGIFLETEIIIVY